MADLLIRYSKEYLETKTEVNLKTVLDKGFGITQGISKFTKDQLINLILEKRQEKLQQLHNQNKVNPKIIYLNSNDKEFKALLKQATNVYDECVELTDKQDNKTYIDLYSFISQFRPTIYHKFSEIKDNPKSTTKYNSSKDGKKTRAAMVREIVLDLEKNRRKYTSGTVMYLIEERYDTTIHRSYCITLIKKARGDD